MHEIPLLLCTVALCVGGARNGTSYTFFRELRGGGRAASRRVFGGAAADLKEYPGTCALLDRYWTVRCSAAVLTPYWALTAAHCASPLVSYIKYNTRRPASSEGNLVAVHYLYRHPEYRVLQEDDGHGVDVTLLHHDVGLVRTRDAMHPAALPPRPLDSLQRYDPMSLMSQEVQVLGFGRTESALLGEELCGARLRLVPCGRGAWFHVVCGAGGAGGVCSGDSGGPVLFAGAQLAVTSLGPRDCASAPSPGAVSVFTTLRPYAGVLNATITDTDATLRMRLISVGLRTRAKVSVLIATVHIMLIHSHVSWCSI